jgi:hypothetical protein
MKSTILWVVTPSSSIEVHLSFGGTIASIFRVEDYAKQETLKKQAYSSTLKIEAIRTSEMSADFYGNARRYNREGCTLQL